MSRARIGVAITSVAILVGLLQWQRHRNQLVNACVQSGGIWNGTASKCTPMPGGPLLQRDLRRS